MPLRNSLVMKNPLLKDDGKELDGLLMAVCDQ